MHREKRNAYARAHYAAHREEEKTRHEAYRAAHRDERNAYSKAYYAAHREERKAYQETWRAANPERYRELCYIQNARRRARLRGASIGDTRGLRAACDFIRTTPRLRCYWCGKAVPVGRRHVEHVMPLARGGAHAAWNLVCSCARCNKGKAAKLPAEFAGQGQLAFA